MHGVATETGPARYGMECVVYMGVGRTCAARQRTCTAWACSARRSCRVESGSKTLKDALNEAMRDWVTNVETTYYIIGTSRRPHLSDDGADFHR